MACATFSTASETRASCEIVRLNVRRPTSMTRPLVGLRSNSRSYLIRHVGLYGPRSVLIFVFCYVGPTTIS